MASIIIQPKPLYRNVFPKKCTNCGKVYFTEADFFQHSTPIERSVASIKTIQDPSDEKGIYLEVFRNCYCGSTLMELFHCRTNISEAGIKRRLLFESLLKSLIQSGYELVDARSLLLELMPLANLDDIHH